MFAFIDTASVRYNRRDPFDGATYRLASLGAGLRAQVANRIGINFGAARSIRSPYAGMAEDWRLFATARVRFGL